MVLNKCQVKFKKKFTSVKEYRKEKGLSQKDLSALLGIRRQTISDWERGEFMPNQDNLKKLAQIFEVDIKELKKNLEVNLSLKQLREALKRLEQEYELTQEDVLALMK